MGDLWQDEGFGTAVGESDDDWEEGDESIDTALDDGFDDPEEPDDDGWADEGDEGDEE
jgi:hypothetical protein